MDGWNGGLVVVEVVRRGLAVLINYIISQILVLVNDSSRVESMKTEETKLNGMDEKSQLTSEINRPAVFSLLRCSSLPTLLSSLSPVSPVISSLSYSESESSTE